MSRGARLAAIVVVVAALVTTTSGCDYATRKKEAQLLVDAAKRAEATGSAVGSMAIGLDIEKTSPEFAAVARAVKLPPVEVQFSFRDRVASSAGVPRAVFSGPVVYLRRPETVGASDSQFGFRSWSRLDFSKVGKKDSNKLTQPNAVNPINPTYLVRMLAGTLSGSVRELDSTLSNTRHFKMNIDRGKAFRGLNDTDHQAVDKAFASDNISGQVYKGAEVWINNRGLPRRFVLRIRQKLDQDNVFRITYRIDLPVFGEPVTIHTPTPGNTADVSTFNALLNGAVPS